LTKAFEPPFLIGIDVGTQSVRALAFDAQGRKMAQSSRPTPVTMHDGDRGEYDPDGLFAAVKACLADTAKALAGGPVAGMAVASVGESCVAIDAQGRALAPSLLWFDRRTEGAARDLATRIDPERVFQITGLAIDPTLSLFKLIWMRQQWPEALARTRRVLCIADWIAFRLCGEAATDTTLASRTLYFDIHQRRWSEELLSFAGFEAGMLGRLLPSGSALAPVRSEILAETGLAGRPVVAVGGHDHLCGSYAAGITAADMLLDSMGTAEAILLATSVPLRDPAVVRHGFIQGAMTTHRALWYLGTTINSSGGAVEWFRALSGGAPHETLIEEARAAGPGSHGVVFLPHLVYAPSPDPDTAGRGAFVGLTAHATRGALYRAVLEGLSMQARFMLEAVAGLPHVAQPRQIRAIGGMSRNPLFMEIKASVLNRPIMLVDEPEATSLGTALLGGVAAGLWPDLDAALAALDRRHRTVEPHQALVSYYADLYGAAFRGLQTTLKPVNHALGGLDRTANAAPT
jgi:xylulokinase